MQLIKQQIFFLIRAKLSLLFITLIFFLISSAFVSEANAAVGQTNIAKWKNNLKAAFTMNFDDSMISQADNAMPAMVQRGLVGTWFINPGMDRYKSRRQVWEETAPASGQEFANHTMNHEGAGSYAEADYEIGECARIIWSLRPANASKLLPFSQGGGTTWSISSQELQQLMNKYYCVYRSSNSMTGADSSTMISYAQRAINNGGWEAIHFHGIGGEWLSVTVSDFVKLLDYLVSVRNDLWVGTWGSVHKYIEERNTVSVSILEANNSLIRLTLASTKDSALYDEPLTLITEIPTFWSSCSANQAGQAKTCSVISGKAQYAAIPGKGEIILTAGGDTTPPAAPTGVRVL